MKNEQCEGCPQFRLYWPTSGSKVALDLQMECWYTVWCIESLLFVVGPRPMLRHCLETECRGGMAMTLP